MSKLLPLWIVCLLILIAANRLVVGGRNRVRAAAQAAVQERELWERYGGNPHRKVVVLQNQWRNRMWSAGRQTQDLAASAAIPGFPTFKPSSKPSHENVDDDPSTKDDVGGSAPSRVSESVLQPAERLGALISDGHLSLSDIQSFERLDDLPAISLPRELQVPEELMQRWIRIRLAIDTPIDLVEVRTMFGSTADANRVIPMLDPTKPLHRQTFQHLVAMRRATAGQLMVWLGGAEITPPPTPELETILADLRRYRHAESRLRKLNPPTSWNAAFHWALRRDPAAWQSGWQRSKSKTSAGHRSWLESAAAWNVLKFGGASRNALNSITKDALDRSQPVAIDWTQWDNSQSYFPIEHINIDKLQEQWLATISNGIIDQESAHAAYDALIASLSSDTTTLDAASSERSAVANRLLRQPWPLERILVGRHRDLKAAVANTRMLPELMFALHDSRRDVGNPSATVVTHRLAWIAPWELPNAAELLTRRVDDEPPIVMGRHDSITARSMMAVVITSNLESPTPGTFETLRALIDPKSGLSSSMQQSMLETLERLVKDQPDVDPMWPRQLRAARRTFRFVNQGNPPAAKENR